MNQLKAGAILSYIILGLNTAMYSIDTEFQQITEVCIKYASKSETAQNSLIYYAI